MLRLLPMRSCLPRRLIQTASTGVSKGGVKLTLFSKPQCGLCEEAKEIIEDVLESDAIPKHNISMNIVNINQLNNKKWWDLYCFDIPVLHIEKDNDKESLFKMMHRIDEDVLVDKIQTYLK